ncbi:effector-associated constant component EACC1 [Actinomadura verrucosospora]|uniref:effector-associated constant component EACC1 n=1 Tax=Actinomadura verrucosospora TaxID=46165 RepID=UPI001565E389|nr:hypothetical protein [Actinomadura verrucosospora]
MTSARESVRLWDDPLIEPETLGGGRVRVDLFLDGLGEDYFLLLRALDEVDHDGVEEIMAPAADGARGAEVMTLAVAIAGSPVLAGLVAVVQDWLARRGSGTIVLQYGEDRLELTGTPTDLHRDAYEAFTARHSE